MILVWICIGFGLIGLLLVINFLVKIHNWKMRGYEETHQALMYGSLEEVKDPYEMTFNSIKNKMYHLGAWEAYRDYRSMFNEGRNWIYEKR
jgi:hypothetical protein